MEAEDATFLKGHTAPPLPEYKGLSSLHINMTKMRNSALQSNILELMSDVTALWLCDFSMFFLCVCLHVHVCNHVYMCTGACGGQRKISFLR